MTGEEMKKKGFSQRGSGNKVPSHLNESPFFEDILAQKTDSVKEENKINQMTNPLAKCIDTPYLDTVNRGYMRIKAKSSQVGDAAVPITAPYVLKASNNSIAQIIEFVKHF